MMKNGDLMILTNGLNFGRIGTVIGLGDIPDTWLCMFDRPVATTGGSMQVANVPMTRAKMIAAADVLEAE